VVGRGSKIATPKSYYDGCSQGGREGLTFAQRFPNDFDGVIAGSPALSNTGNMIARAYWMQGMAVNPFPAAKLGLLAERAYAKCDAADGLKDGLISEPLRCGFKASQDLPRCAEGKNESTCFTASEIASADRIYSDVFRQGQRFFPGWPVGAEVAGPNGESGWLGQVVRGPNGNSVWANYAQDFLRYMAMPGTDPEHAIARFDIDQNIPRVEFLHQVIDATDPDLTAFRQRGGKLIIYFGWADPQLNPRVAVEYYDQVVARMGSSTGDFARLFMVPGMFHCGGGVGTSTFDVATPLLHWVESGVAPTSIPASRILGGKTIRTRPLCPYPEVARYKGSGTIDDAANFSCVAP
jgi:feruloyl esterase